MAKETDDAVMALLVRVQQKKAEISSLKKAPQWKTNCTIGLDPKAKTAHDRVNIVTRTDPSELIDWYIFLAQKEDYITKAASELGLPLDLTYMGYPIADWKDDLKTRATQLSIAQKQKEVEELDKRVNKLVSPDQRREMELKALQQILED